MIAIVTTSSVEPRRTSKHDTWRLLVPETTDLTADQLQSVSGIAEYQPKAASDELGDPHERPEIFYVLEGEGVLETPQESVQVKAGDSFVVPGGIAHGIFAAAQGTTVKAFYVALK